MIVNGINNNMIILSIIGFWFNKLNIVEFKNNIKKYDINFEIIVCSECIFVCLIYNMINMVFEV